MIAAGAGSDLVLRSSLLCAGDVLLRSSNAQGSGNVRVYSSSLVSSSGSLTIGSMSGSVLFNGAGWPSASSSSLSVQAGNSASSLSLGQSQLLVSAGQNISVSVSMQWQALWMSLSAPLLRVSSSMVMSAAVSSASLSNCNVSLESNKYDLPGVLNLTSCGHSVQTLSGNLTVGDSSSSVNGLDSNTVSNLLVTSWGTTLTLGGSKTLNVTLSNVSFNATNRHLRVISQGDVSGSNSNVWLSTAVKLVQSSVSTLTVLASGRITVGDDLLAAALWLQGSSLSVSSGLKFEASSGDMYVWASPGGMRVAGNWTLQVC